MSDHDGGSFYDESRGRVGRQRVPDSTDRATRLAPPHKRDWSVHPGEIIAEELAERAITQAEVSRRTGYTPKHVNEVIRGHKPLSAGFALALEKAVGVPAHVLLRIQADHSLWQVEHGEKAPR